MHKYCLMIAIINRIRRDFTTQKCMARKLLMRVRLSYAEYWGQCCQIYFRIIRLFLLIRLKINQYKIRTRFCPRKIRTKSVRIFLTKKFVSNYHREVFSTSFNLKSVSRCFLNRYFHSKTSKCYKYTVFSE